MACVTVRSERLLNMNQGYVVSNVALEYITGRLKFCDSTFCHWSANWINRHKARSIIMDVLVKDEKYLSCDISLYINQLFYWRIFLKEN